MCAQAFMNILTAAPATSAGAQRASRRRARVPRSQATSASPRSTSTLWFLPFTLIVSATTPPAVFRPVTRSLFRPKLSERAQPILHMEGLGDLAVLDGLYIDRHDLEALAGMRHAKQFACGRARHFTAHDHPVARDEDLLNVELQIGNAVSKVRNDLDGRFATPTFVRQIAGTRLVIRRQDLFLGGPDIAARGDIEQAVPRRNDGPGLFLGQRLCRRSRADAAGRRGDRCKEGS